jgi:hypothetical protein
MSDSAWKMSIKIIFKSFKASDKELLALIDISSTK